jgi:chromosome segregation ATPase
MVPFWQGKSELSSTPSSLSSDLTIMTVPVHRDGFLNPFNKSSAELADARHTNNQLTVHVADLQDQCNALTTTKALLNGQVEQQFKDLASMKQDCNVLRVTARILETKLHSTQATVRDLEATVQQLLNGLIFAHDCNRQYKRSILSKKQDIDTLEQQPKALQCTSDTDSSEPDTLKQSLHDPQSELAELLLSTKAQSIHIAKLEAARLATQAAHDKLLHERDLQLDTHKHSITALQAENDVLASRLAAANHQATQQIELLHAFNHQLLDLTDFHADQQQQQHDLKAQRDGLYAQTQHNHARFEAKLKSKDAAHQALGAKLRQAEEEAARHASAQEDEIAGLKEQLCRLKLDCDGAVAAKEAWAEYANGGR